MGESPRPQILVDLYCPVCDYNLRTVSCHGVCPECGTPISTSFARERRFEAVERLYSVAAALCFVGILMAGLIQFAHAVLTFSLLLSAVAVLGLAWLAISKRARRSRVVWIGTLFGGLLSTAVLMRLYAPY